MVSVCDKLGIGRQHSCLEHLGRGAGLGAAHLQVHKLLGWDVRLLEGIGYSLRASDGGV
jgi:hypothetical protein